MYVILSAILQTFVGPRNVRRPFMSDKILDCLKYDEKCK